MVCTLLRGLFRGMGKYHPIADKIISGFRNVSMWNFCLGFFLFLEIVLDFLEIQYSLEFGGFIVNTNIF